MFFRNVARRLFVGIHRMFWVLIKLAGIERIFRNLTSYPGGGQVRAKAQLPIPCLTSEQLRAVALREQQQQDATAR